MSGVLIITPHYPIEDSVPRIGSGRRRVESRWGKAGAGRRRWIGGMKAELWSEGSWGVALLCRRAVAVQYSSAAVRCLAS